MPNNYDLPTILILDYNFAISANEEYHSPPRIGFCRQFLVNFASLLVVWATWQTFPLCKYSQKNSSKHFFSSAGQK